MLRPRRERDTASTVQSLRVHQHITNPRDIEVIRVDTDYVSEPVDGKHTTTVAATDVTGDIHAT